MEHQGPRTPIDLQNGFLAASGGKDVTEHEAPKSASRAFPARPKWLQYPKMYRKSNKRGAKSDVKKSSVNTRTTLVPSVDSPQKTILNHFVHSPTTPKTSRSSPSVPPSTQISQNSHNGENLRFDLPQEDAIQAGGPLVFQPIIVESSAAEDVDELEDEPAPAALAKTNHKPLKAIRKAFARKKPEVEEEDVPRRSSPGQAEKTTDLAGTGPVRRMFNKKSQSKRQLMSEEVSETERVCSFVELTLHLFIFAFEKSHPISFSHCYFRWTMKMLTENFHMLNAP